jgi:hypothetical protein
MPVFVLVERKGGHDHWSIYHTHVTLEFYQGDGPSGRSEGHNPRGQFQASVFLPFEESFCLAHFLTIFRHGLSTNASAIRVEVSRTPCTVLSASLMQIVCVLGAQRSLLNERIHTQAQFILGIEIPFCFHYNSCKRCGRLRLLSLTI